MTFTLIRYGIFAFFILFNALVGAVAALNFGLALGISQTAIVGQIDTFLIILGILGTLFLFVLITIELTRKNALISQVRFELVWVAAFWIFHVAGSAATTSAIPNILCAGTARSASFACTSTQALIALSWLSMVFHLGYLVFLLFLTLSRASRDKSVWRSSVAKYPWYQAANSSANALEARPYNVNFGYEQDTVSRTSESTLASEKGFDMIVPGKFADEVVIKGVARTYDPHVTDRHYPRPMDRYEPRRPQQEHVLPYSISTVPQPLAQPAALSVFNAFSGNNSGSSGATNASFKTPSPAVVQSVQRKGTLKQLSLYPQVVNNAGLTTKPVAHRQYSDPSRRSAAAEQDSALKLSLGPTPKVETGRKGHTASSSVDSGSSGTGPKKVKHRPPPLDLSALSNITNSKRRR